MLYEVITDPGSDVDSAYRRPGSICVPDALHGYGKRFAIHEVNIGNSTGDRGAVVKGDHDPAFANVAYVHEEIRLTETVTSAAVSANGFEAKPDSGGRAGTAGREQKGPRRA